MRTFNKILFVLLLGLSVNACGKNTDNVFVEKDGQKYEVADQGSFYYPKDFAMDTSSKNNEVISFVKDQEIIFYTMMIDDTDNRVEDMPELYAGQLEEDGATDVAFRNITIDSGLNCQEFSGVYQSTGIKFKHMVYFTDHATYVLSYQAPQKIYDQKVEDISKYLDSLVVHE